MCNKQILYFVRVIMNLGIVGIVDKVLYVVPCITIPVVSVFWLCLLFKELVKKVRSYRLNKKKFFPDEIYKKRILYNLETHIVKDIFLLILIVVELVVPVSGVLYLFTRIRHIPRGPWYVPNIIQKGNCSIKQVIKSLITNNLCVENCTYPDVLFYSQSAITVCIFMTLLSLLCRYLAARYLRHSVNSFIKKYIVWLCVKLLLFLPGLSKYTLGLYMIVSLPIMVSDWIVLLRDSNVLRNVLKSHIKELEMHFSRRLYLQEKRLYNLYRGCIVFLLASLFFYILGFALTAINHTLLTILSNSCIVSLIEANNQLYRPLRVLHLVYKVLYEFVLLLVFIHFALLTLPLHIATVTTLVYNCIKRCRGVNKRYIHYNYEIMQELLRKQKERRN